VKEYVEYRLGMKHHRLLPIGLSLVINIMFSLIVLPYAIPPFGNYAFTELMEVLLWQEIFAIGWPFAILGSFYNLINEPRVDSVVALLLTLLYPAMLGLMVRMLIAGVIQRWQWVLLNLLVLASFVALWYSVRNGYDFMVG
jgi:hypothetical protein